MHIHWNIIYGSFGATIADLNSYVKNHMAYKTDDTYPWPLTKKVCRILHYFISCSPQKNIYHWGDILIPILHKIKVRLTTTYKY